MYTYYNMYTLDPETIKWGARIFLLIIIVLSIYLIIRKKRRTRQFVYKGIQKLAYTDLLIPPYLKSTVANGIGILQSKPAKSPRVNKTEEMCRKIIEKIYNKKFPSVRPDWLKSPKTKKNLELDCYNKDLKIALEYNGQQHYRFTPHFHKTKTKFFSQVHRDDWKRKKCLEKGIRLIEIPYWVTPMDLEQYIIKELQKKNCL